MDLIQFVPSCSSLIYCYLVEQGSSAICLQTSSLPSLRDFLEIFQRFSRALPEFFIRILTLCIFLSIPIAKFVILHTTALHAHLSSSIRKLYKHKQYNSNIISILCNSARARKSSVAVRCQSHKIRQAYL